MEDNKRKLYDALSAEYDLGTFEQFSTDIQDADKRKKLYDATINDYDFGDYDSFSSQLGFSPAQENPTPQVNNEPYEFGKPMYGQAPNHVEGDIYKHGDSYTRTEIPYRTVEYPTLGEAQEAEKAEQREDALAAYRSAYNRLEAPGEVDEKTLIEWGNNMENAPIEQKNLYTRIMGQDATNRVDLDAVMRSYDEAKKSLEGVEDPEGLAAYLMMPAEQKAKLPEDERNRYEGLIKDKRKTDAVDDVNELHERISSLMEQQRVSDIKMRHDYLENRSTGQAIKDAILGIPVAETPQLQGVIPSSGLDLTPEGKLSNEQNAVLTAAGRKWNEMKYLINAAQNGNLFDGLDKALGSIDTWTSDQMLRDNMAIMRVANKFDEEGEKSLTDNERALLDALALNVAVSEMYGDEISNWYKGGEMLGEMAPFMLEMLMNPLAGLGKKAADKVTLKAIEKYGKELVKKNAKKFALTHGAAKLGASVAGATGMALTTGLPAVGADIQKRMLGDATYGYDDEGNIEYTGHVGGEGLGTSAYKAVTSRMLDNVSEMLGAEYANLPLKWLQKAGKGTKLLGWIDNLANSKFGKGVSRFAEKTKWNGPIEEFLEEVHVGLINPVLVGDQSWEEFFTKDNLATIAIGVAVPGAAISTANTIAGAADGAFKVGAQERWKMQNAEAMGYQLWQDNPNEWNDLTRSLMVGQMEDVEKTLKEVYNNSKLTPEQKKVALEYAVYSLQWRTAQGVKEAFNEGKKFIDPMLRDIYGTAYAEEVSPVQANNAYKAMVEAEKNAQRVLGLGDRSVEEWLNGRSAEEATNDAAQQEALKAYQAAKLDFEGRRDRYIAEKERAYMESDKSIQANDNNGMVYATQLKDEPVFITGGNVVLNEDGTIDVDNSSETLYVKFPDGHVEMTSPDKFTEVFTSDRTADLKAAKRAEIDAKWKAEFDTAEAQSVEQEKREAGVVFDKADAQGNHRIEILNEGEDMSNILFDGAETEIPTEELNRWKQEAGIQTESAVADDTTDNVAPTGDNVTPVENAPIAANPVDPKQRKAEVLSRIPMKGKQRMWTEANPADVAEYISLLTEDPAKRMAVVDGYIAKVQEAQAKAEPIEALEMDEQIAFWNGIKEMLAPQTAQAENVAQTTETTEEVGPVEQETTTIEGEDVLHPSVAAANEGRDTVGGSPVALAYLLEGGQGSILNAGYFLHGVAAAFPAVSNEIETLRAAMSEDVLGMSPTDFVAQRADEIAQIGELITNAYGEAGAAIYNELLNNASGFVPRVGAEVGARIEALQPLGEPTLSQTSDQVGEQVVDNVPGQSGVPVNDVQGGSQNGVAQEEVPVNEPVGNSEQLSSSEIPNNQSVAEGDAPGKSGVYADNQGNPVDADGKLIVDEVNLIDEITDEDFETPTRNVQLPAIPENVANAIGTNGRPVVIKKNVFEKNGNTHVELEPEDSRNILRSALYNPNLVGSTQPIRRPDYKVAIRTGEQNAVVVLDVYQEKDFVEIVGWRMVNEKGLAKMQRQAEREGGQFLILSPNNGSAAALSALPLGLSSASEGTAQDVNLQENAQKSGESAENGGEIQETFFLEETLDNGDKKITGMNSRGEVATVAIERDGKMVSVDSYDKGVLFEHTEYDGNGKAKSVTRYDKQGNVVGTQKYENGKAKTPMQKLADRILDRTEEKRRIPLRERARELEAQVGVKANIIESVDEVADPEARRRIVAGQNVAGWYSKGQVYLYMPNLQDRREIELTYVHEVVAHHGVKKLLRERFNEFLDGVWNMMSEADRARMLAYVGANENPTLQDMRAAADEYVAEIAEKMDLNELERSTWEKIVGWFKELLENIGFENLTKEDIESMLKASYANLRSTEQGAQSKENDFRAKMTFHGSGAKFDRFDHAFMGTGEGAQAFGWGTYVTEVEGIGRIYAEGTSGNIFKSGFGDFYLKKIREGLAEGKSFEEIKQGLLEFHAHLYEQTGGNTEMYGDFIHDYNKLQSLKEEDLPKRNLYSVEIPDDNGSNYLHWEERINGEIQERVANGLQNIGFEIEPDMNHLAYSRDGNIAVLNINDKGKDLYAELSEALGGDKQASLFLNDMGFVGISYPAEATSGGRADGARNYVIFNENDAQIKDRTMFRKKDSERRQEKRRINDAIDTAAGFITVGGKKQATKNRLKKEAERKQLAKEMYSSVLKGDFNDVTLSQIDKFIEDATPANPFGRRISQRLPQRMERALRQGARTNAVDALFSRISESAVPANERFSEAGRREIEERKKELLKGWAIATGNWHTDLKEFTDDNEPIGEGKDSKVYSSKDGRYVIKASKGKPYGKRFRPDIDNIALFNDVFRDTRYEILGYGEIDGEFVRILQQPIVDFAQSTPLTSEERREYMQSLGFEPLNDANTAFADGEIVIADLQKGNVVRDAAGNISVIDADAKLHTKDVGGDYTYPPVEEDLPEQETMFRIIDTDRQALEFKRQHKGSANIVAIDTDALVAELLAQGFTAEEIPEIREMHEKGVLGFYDRKRNTIYLLGKDHGEKENNATFWHENTHKAIGELDVPQEIMDEFYAMPSERFIEFFERKAKEFYEPEEYAEELIAYFVEDVQSNGNYDNVTKALGTSAENMERLKEIVEPIINYINHGRRTNEGTEGNNRTVVRETIGNGDVETLSEGARRETEGAGETRFSTRGEGIDNVPTQPLTLMERITNSLLEVSAKNKENLELRASALRTFGRDINRVLSLMKAQREYDKSTVDTLVKLAKMYFQNAQLLGEVTPYEVARIMGVLNRSVGKRDISTEAAKLMDILLDAHANALAGILDKAEKIKAKKVNAAGVEVMGRLDKYGQKRVDEYRAAKGMTPEKLEEAIYDSDNRLAELEQRVREVLGIPDGDVDQAARDYTGDNDVVNVYMDERARLEGLTLAREYKESIQQVQEEIKDLKQELKQAEEDYRLGNIDGKSLKEFRKSVAEAIMESKAELIEGYHSLIYKFQENTKESSQRAKEFAQAQIDRAREIQHNANSDMEGIPADTQGTHPGNHNNAVMNALRSPFPTFQGMLKKFGEKNAEGKGYLYDRFMPQATQASDNEFRGKVAARVMIEAKLKEIYGEKANIARFMKELREYGATVTYREGNEMKQFDLTKGQMLYIYMVNKMADGQMKLRRMGITDDVVAELMTKLPEEAVQFADWAQNELLKDLRGKYNAVHERVFGAPMAAIENYFPIKIRKEARGEKGDVSEVGQEGKPSTVTGSIIKRTKNATAIDLSADAMQVLMEHIDDMEHWAAFAEFNRDLNVLLNYKHFQNQVKNMTSVRYGSGEEMWKNFKKTAQIVSGTYRPSDLSFDRAVQNIAKGLTRSKINFRLYTAIKQLLSAPAFWTDAGVEELAYCYANPKGSFKWALENLPGFAERWQGRTMGNEKLLKSDSDWEMWRNEFVEKATRWGMTPNAAIDALTVAQGARAVYMTKLEQFKKAGYTEQRANEKALQAAAEAYNESQQSSEGIYLSPLQVEGTAMAAVFTTFKNSNFGYTRKTAQAVANIKRKMRKGYKEETIAFMTKQMVRDGLSEADAKKMAEKVYNRSKYKDVANVAMFGFGLNLLWEAGGMAIYLLFGDDDEEKEKMMKEIALRGSLGLLNGVPFGETMISAAMAVKEGDTKYFRLPELVAVSDIKNLAQVLNDDPVRGANDIVNMLTSMGVGVTPQVLTDILVAFGDVEEFSAEELGMFVARFMNAPQSNLDRLMVDDAMEDSAINADEMMRRYAEYKKSKNAPITQFLYPDATEQEALERYMKRFNKMLDERLENVVEDNDAYDLFYKGADARMKSELAKMRQNYLAEDKAEAFEKMDAKELVERVLYGSGEINEAYFNLSTAEDEDDAFVLKSVLKELNDLVEEGMQTDEEERLLRGLKAINNAINKAKRLMKQQPDKAQEHMNKIREMRAEAIKQINNYRKDE